MQQEQIYVFQGETQYMQSQSEIVIAFLQHIFYAFHKFVNSLFFLKRFSEKHIIYWLPYKKACMCFRQHGAERL